MSHNNTNQPEQTWPQEHEVLFGFLATGATLLPVAIILFCIFCLPRLHDMYRRKKNYGLSNAEWSGLSYHSQKLIQKYFALPVDARPWPNLYHTLLNIDAKYGGRDEYNRTYSEYREACPEHRQLGVLINDIKENVRQRDIAISASTVPDVDHEVAMLTARLRAEADIIEKVTKEIK